MHPDRAINYGYGCRLGEAPPSVPMAWIIDQYNNPIVPPPNFSTPEALRLRRIDFNPPASLRPNCRYVADVDRAASLKHVLTTNQGYLARIVIFWQNHFSIGSTNVGDVRSVLQGAFEQEVVWPNLRGSLANMLYAGCMHPAMLNWLNNDLNFGPNSVIGLRNPARGKNENLAREILELYSLGPGHYTQADIVQLALILSGHHIRTDGEPYGYYFNSDAHEPGSKVVRGKTYPEGSGAVRMVFEDLAKDPICHRFIATKFARHFWADDVSMSPYKEGVDLLVQAFSPTLNPLTQLHRVLRDIPGYDHRVSLPMGQKTKSPQDLMVSFFRGAGADPADPAIQDLFFRCLSSLGQPYWNQPGPNGFPDTTLAWATPTQKKLRMQWFWGSIAPKFVENKDLEAVSGVAKALFGTTAPSGIQNLLSGVSDQQASSLRELLTQCGVHGRFGRR